MIVVVSVFAFGGAVITTINTGSFALGALGGLGAGLGGLFIWLAVRGRA